MRAESGHHETKNSLDLKEIKTYQKLFTLLSILYVAVFIKDTRGPYSENSQQQSYDLIGAFSIWNITEVFKTSFKQRANYGRSILVILITAMLYNVSTISKLSQAFYIDVLFTYQFSIRILTIFSTCFLSFQMGVLLFTI